MNRDLCIYHGNCADGFGSAWAVREAYKTFNLGEEPEFFPAMYGKGEIPNVDGRHVMMVDFSYRREVLLRLAERAKSILILDHHATSKNDLVDLPGNVHTVFDMERSGARITWDYYFKDSGIKPPELIRIIEDRDLWRFSLGERYTREVQAAVFSYPYDFEVWDTLMETNPTLLRQDGEAIERKHFKDINELLPTVTFIRKVEGYDVPFANVPYFFSSDAGNMLCKMFNPDLFSVCYWDLPTGRQLSLRSVKGQGMDVEAIAKTIGKQPFAVSGGGHKHAAGAVLTASHPLAQREPSAESRFIIPADLQHTSSRE